MAGVSNDLEDDDLSFKVKSLFYLEDNANIMILFTYGVVLGEECSWRMCEETLARALAEQHRGGGDQW